MLSAWSHAFLSMRCEQSQAEPHSWPHAQGLNQMTFQGPFQIKLLHDLRLKWPKLRRFMSLKIFRSTYRQRPWFLNKSLIPSSGLDFKHKCCWKSSQRCSDVLAFGSQSSSRMAAGAPIQEVGSQTLRRAQCRMQSKEARDAQFPDKHQFLYKKKSSTLI